MTVFVKNIIKKTISFNWHTRLGLISLKSHTIIVKNKNNVLITVYISYICQLNVQLLLPVRWGLLRASLVPFDSLAVRWRCLVLFGGHGGHGLIVRGRPLPSEGAAGSVGQNGRHC